MKIDTRVVENEFLGSGLPWNSAEPSDRMVGPAGMPNVGIQITTNKKMKGRKHRPWDQIYIYILRKWEGGIGCNPTRNISSHIQTIHEGRAGEVVVTLQNANSSVLFSLPVLKWVWHGLYIWLPFNAQIPITQFGNLQLPPTLISWRYG